MNNKQFCYIVAGWIAIVDESRVILEYVSWGFVDDGT